MRFALAATLAVATVLAYVLWIKSRRPRVALRLDDGIAIEELARSIAAHTWGRLSHGNRVTIIQNSDFFDALLADVAAARHSVHLESFLWQNGVVSDRVTDALAKKAREGVEVRVLVDQRGAKKTDPATWARIREAGCEFRVFHRMRFLEFARYNHRDHRKVALIDGRIGYTFGHGIADMWGGTPQQPNGWRDTAARIEGPAVYELQAAFFDNWVRVSGVALAGERYFPPLKEVGSTVMHVAWHAPRETQSAVHRLYYFALRAAKHELILQNPYFLPDRQAIQLFTDAVQRGVRIRIMLPTATTSDFAIVQHASHHYYGPLLRLGVELYEFTRSGLHQKVLIVDRQWCSIGSTNFDPRSFRLNDEINVAIYDATIAEELRDAFEADIEGAERWTLERWNGRSPRHRLRDGWSALFKGQL